MAGDIRRDGRAEDALSGYAQGQSEEEKVETHFFPFGLLIDLVVMWKLSKDRKSPFGRKLGEERNERQDTEQVIEVERENPNFLPSSWTSCLYLYVCMYVLVFGT